MYLCTYLNNVLNNRLTGSITDYMINWTSYYKFLYQIPLAGNKADGSNS